MAQMDMDSEQSSFAAARAENLNILWAQLIVEECVRGGVTLFCVSPGSRSTPLAVAIARNPRARAAVFPDERAAAFYALGYARSSGSIAACVCTSGTAAANYLPALVEASYDGVPLLLLTADRPPELRETGANQTIRQPALFGDLPRWSFDLPCPDEAISPAFVLSTVAHAIFRARSSPAGGAHLNCMFREPLAPAPDGRAPFERYLEPVAAQLAQNSPFTEYIAFDAASALSDATAKRVCDALLEAKFPLLVVGRLRSQAERDAVLRLASALNVPVLPDIASGLRLSAPSAVSCLVPYFDQTLLAPDAFGGVKTEAKPDAKPDAVLHIGGSCVSKRLLQWLDHAKPTQYIILDETPFRRDANHQATMRIHAPIVAAAEALTRTARAVPTSEAAQAIMRSSAAVEQELEEYLNTELSADAPISEITAAMIVSRAIENGAGLFLSNSMPIRDMDMYALRRSDDGYIAVGTNRGASGIDGIIASAGGFAAGLGAPATLMIGDIASIHDLNSLLLAQENPAPLIIVLLNNRGGGIFSFLPIASETAIFERFWGTPHKANFQAAAEFAGLAYAAPKTAPEFERAYALALERARNESRSTLLEILVERQDNAVTHRALQQRIIRRLRENAQATETLL